jgi:streptomycin 6-kinase
MNDLQKNMINIYGKEGEDWLTNLPVLIQKMEHVYGLSHLVSVNNLSFNYVLSGMQGSQPIILKLSLDSDSLKREANALKAFAGFGVVKLLMEQEGVLLLEQVMPGESLRSFFPKRDDESVRIACDCLKRLHQAEIPKNHQFPLVSDWLNTLDTEHNIPSAYLERARELRNELLVSSAQSVLLHGDLHHDNILRHGSGWLVIDPKGVIGEPAYEVAALIRNPIPSLIEHQQANHLIAARIKLFADLLKLPEKRIASWCYVQAVLAWAWALEDGWDTEYFKSLCDYLRKSTPSAKS